MKVCYTAGPVKKLENCFSVSTNAVEIRIWFLTDDILRIRAGFDGDWDEASYSLTMTAWDSRTDELMKDCRKRVQTAAAELTDGDKQAVIQGSRLKVVVEKAPFRIMVYDKDGSLLHADIPDLAYREDSNHRRMHASQIEADDCFYGFGEKSGEINKAEKYMNMAPGDAMGYNAKETDSLYKHIPFYIKLNRGTKQAVGYFYHNTAECDFNMGREKRNYWHRYSTYRTDAGDVDLFLIAGPSIRDIIERYTDLTGKSVMLPKAALGYLGSSMYYPELPENSDDAVLEFIDTTHEEDIPVDGFQLSSGYCAVETEQGIKRCTFTWNNKRFKDPADWFAQMVKRGILVSPNIKPGMLLVHPLLEEMKAKDMFLPASDDNAGVDGLAVGTWWGGPGLFVDYTKESTRLHWKQYIKDAIDFRYKLSPMLYSLMVRAHESGLPIWQPTFAVFQNDPATYDEGVDFMFGDSLLVANVVEKGQTVRPVYLPKTEDENERFYNFYTREEYTPGQTIEVPVDISSIPLFVRSGAILPMSGNRLHNLMTEKTTALEILMAPDVDSEFVLYEDDGCTNEYLKGAYLKTRIAVTAGVKTYIHFTNEGDYDTAVESMYLDMIHREKSPFYVQLDGKELPHFLHRRKFEEAESGWYYSQRLKSVQVKYPNPKKDHEVMVSFEQFDLIGM